MRATAISPIGATKRVDRFKRKPEPVGYAEDLLEAINNPMTQLAPLSSISEIWMTGRQVDHYELFNKAMEFQILIKEKLTAWIRRYKI